MSEYVIDEGFDYFLEKLLIYLHFTGSTMVVQIHRTQHVSSKIIALCNFFELFKYYGDIDITRVIFSGIRTNS